MPIKKKNLLYEGWKGGTSLFLSMTEVRAAFELLERVSELPTYPVPAATSQSMTLTAKLSIRNLDGVFFIQKLIYFRKKLYLCGLTGIVDEYPQKNFPREH